MTDRQRDILAYFSNNEQRTKQTFEQTNKSVERKVRNVWLRMYCVGICIALGFVITIDKKNTPTIHIDYLLCMYVIFVFN